MDELALLHAGYRGAELSWLTPPDGMRRKPTDGELAARRTHFIQLGLDQFGDEMGPAFRALAELYIARSGDIIALFNEGEHTLIHGDDHSGNLFVDAGRTGFYDWAVASRAPGRARRRVFPVQLVAGGNPPRRTGFAARALPRGAGGQRLDTRRARPSTTSTGCSRSTRGSPRCRPPRWARSGSPSRSPARR